MKKKISINNLVPVSVARLLDNDVDRVVFDISAWRNDYPALVDYRIEVTNPRGDIYFPNEVNLDGDDLIWTITSSDTAYSGTGLYQIVATGIDGERKTSAYTRFVVKDIMSGTASETPPSPTKAWVDSVLCAAEKVENAVVHPPIISSSGTWLLWDFSASAYVDSGVSAQGNGSGDVSREEFDRLSEEKADKKDIPAPYTLPTASAEVKGGVKIGEGLQMNGDVLETKNKTNIKLMTTTIPEEETEVAYITYRHENGESLMEKYQGLVIYVYLPKRVNESVSDYRLAVYGKTSLFQSQGSPASIFTQYEGKVVIMVDWQNMPIYKTTQSQQGYNTSAYPREDYSSVIHSKNDLIGNEIKIGSGNVNIPYFLPGTTVEIYAKLR